ncbi:MAG: tRNA preQ1(34) S-adenosylmethionine ribosyltransferase-isomerase QueA [Chloroflexi bacterium]|nr:tRNA preQ1(34) S-adenosylmethionine ribosyltransferase-isomerase QueA [Chloroflexota bacterium]
MKTSDFDYCLPPGLIAQVPVEPRDSSRLMVLDRSRATIEHRYFRDIIDYLNTDDLLVFNDTRVIPARIKGRRETGARLELLLLRKRGECLWEALVKPGRVKMGEKVILSPRNGAQSRMTAEIGEPCGGGSRLVRFPSDTLPQLIGEIPLPPYVHVPLADATRYQTVYAREDGSAAAPTAGLHFTTGLMQSLAEKGVNSAFLTLHIGLDTFRPVRVEDPKVHSIHTEFCHVGGEVVEAIRRTRRRGGRIIPIGTTSVRTLEAAAAQGQGEVSAYAGMVDLFILPGYKFELTDAMVTNFHLPRTTLLMMVSAFAGTGFILNAYREAIDHQYRFYSLGDAMLIL